ncbi:unnamed protein product [Acidocella sp. C78]|uniref:hypothetical protein n=1 Tax=Acidocella sp. C78 TaxID=1671486 RepID=UPI00191BB9AD|nr:hypothetical protein [Acidocella sp. C78]CAG4906963.1 unnamed protein product [Acidocella sp. C78]
MDVARRFRALIDTLCDAVARRGAAGVFGPESGALTILLWTRLRRYATFLIRLCDNQVSAPRPRPTRHRERRPVDRARLALPRRAAWLLAPVPEAVAAAGQLRALLAEPELQRRIAADPRFGRILRPLCRTLGLKLPAALRLPQRPRKRRPKPETTQARADEADAKLPRRFRPPAWLRRRERPRGPPPA